MCRWPCKYGEAAMLCGGQWLSSERKPDSKKPASRALILSAWVQLPPVDRGF